MQLQSATGHRTRDGGGPAPEVGPARARRRFPGRAGWRLPHPGSATTAAATASTHTATASHRPLAYAAPLQPRFLSAALLLMRLTPLPLLGRAGLARALACRGPPPHRRELALTLLLHFVVTRRAMPSLVE